LLSISVFAEKWVWRTIIPRGLTTMATSSSHSYRDWNDHIAKWISTPTIDSVLFLQNNNSNSKLHIIATTYLRYLHDKNSTRSKSSTSIDATQINKTEMTACGDADFKTNLLQMSRETEMTASGDTDFKSNFLEMNFGNDNESAFSN